MEIIREHGIDIEAVCGGACACATCHVVVESDWAEKLHPARDDEESMLDMLPSVADTSRLSCQIIYQTALDGLELRLGKTG
jgi:2Fe-2S ferredoxin